MNKQSCQLAVRRMTGRDLELVLTWRNYPGVRRYMYTQHQISLDEHQRWFQGASQDPDKHLLIFEVEKRPLGFVNISQLRSSLIAEWGFYLAPDAPRGSGCQLGREALTYAFDQLKLRKICGESFAHNQRSIDFHRRLGFHEEGVLRHQYFDGRDYQDVVCFGLLATEWRSNK